MELSTSTANPSFFFNHSSISSFPFSEFLSSTTPKIPPASSASLFLRSKHSPISGNKRRRIKSHTFISRTAHFNPVANVQLSDIAAAQVEEPVEVAVAEGYTTTQFCDKIIEVFLNEKPKAKEWRKYLVFREEWKKYRETFYNRCRSRADAETDPTMKQKLISLGRKVKKIDDEMEGHSELLKEIQDSPTDTNAIVSQRRKDFTGEFFSYLTLVSETYDSLEDRDAMARLGARCLSAVSAYDNTLEYVDTLDVAQAKFDDILDSPSVDVACEKIKSLAKAKDLDSSLILLINSAWASAKESTTMTNEVKDIMHRLYKATKSSLRSIAPKEIKLLKHLLNITDPEERFSALATAFSPGDGQEAKDPNALYTTPKELHKWIKIMLDAYNLNTEDSDIREAKQMAQPVVVQRLSILKETIEEEYLEHSMFQDSKTEGDAKSDEL
ncbi:hypothetical protein I3843_07G041700 [Carya illinoinensis]|nr:uncharacterized protein At4g37920 isoform X1 [Carya illinoinensis]KAG2696066.1 hypothetical protein I3760_07G041100 [Carya illinoinensis]KAG2696067.1 hypothetical protein I3760_07G041100 [Carya illinoinensis]KAG7969649.1 hypothetical protein I3843_07G041700 [Carya illinoinensis]